MSFVTRPFTGTDFFDLIRTTPEWISNRGMFAGEDGNKRYVIMDATFYKLEIFLRPHTERFTTSAVDRQTTNPLVRVITNGQFFGPVGAWVTGQTTYCHLNPCPVDYQGETIRSHTVHYGDPTSRSLLYHLGQFDGRTARAYDIARGNPSAVTRDGGYNFALGALIPLIYGGVSATSSQLGTFSGANTTMGKTCMGIHRTSNTIFVFVEEDELGTITIPDLIALLNSMGVDDAAIGDCGSSSALIVDGVVEVRPLGPMDRKDKSIPDGPEFILTDLRIDPSLSQISLNVANTTDATFLDSDPGINPLFYNTPQITGLSGSISCRPSGLDFIIPSMGLYADTTGTSTITREAAAPLGISLPLILTSVTTDITRPSDFNISSGNVSARLRLIVENSADDGRLEGTFRIRTSGGATVAIDVNLPILD